MLETLHPSSLIFRSTLLSRSPVLLSPPSLVPTRTLTHSRHWSLSPISHTRCVPAPCPLIHAPHRFHFTLPSSRFWIFCPLSSFSLVLCGFLRSVMLFLSHWTSGCAFSDRPHKVFCRPMGLEAHRLHGTFPPPVLVGKPSFYRVAYLNGPPSALFYRTCVPRASVRLLLSVRSPHACPAEQH